MREKIKVQTISKKFPVIVSKIVNIVIAVKI
jgi:hypothetical protein